MNKNEIICPHCKEETIVDAIFDKTMPCIAPVVFKNGGYTVEYDKVLIGDESDSRIKFICPECGEAIDRGKLNKAWEACHKPKKRRDSFGRKLEPDLFKKAK